MKHETAELEGNALDEVCAIAEKRAYRRRKDGRLTVSDPGTAGQMADICIEGYRPSADWSWGGPIIERERINLRMDGRGFFAAVYEPFAIVRWHKGPTPLVAAMRAYVASKLGAEVEIPD